jgi:hypothetical protein
MEMNIEVKPDWGAPEEQEERVDSTLASDHGAGVLGFTGTGGKPDTATGLATLAGDTFGGGPTAPMVPNSWNPEPNDPSADTGKTGEGG